MKYTEIFYSIQGEGKNIGKLCTWLRTFSCTLECKGFGQEEPHLPHTWIDPFKGIDVKNITDLKDLPTPKYGCDSAYSWSTQFRHLVQNEQPEDLAEMIRNSTPNKSFENKIGHVFTGGEPMMHQRALARIIDVWLTSGDMPAWIAVETNGTVGISDELYNALMRFQMIGPKIRDVYFSISPKLLHVSGETPKKAIDIKSMHTLIRGFPGSYLKFVLNSRIQAWEQAKQIVEDVENFCGKTNVEVWAMPVGGTYEQQDTEETGKLADMAIQMGWHVSPRVHVMLWKNDQIGR